jgi:uncharacterized membrane protein
MADLLIFGAVLVAASLEVFEAYLIVIAVGHEIGMPRAIAASALAAVVLVILLLGLGSLVLALPAVQVITGAVLFCLGARWLVKSTLKLSGRLERRDDEIPSRLTVWTGQLAAAKGTFMEGVEVVIIVGAMADGHQVTAVAGALAAVALVLAVGYRLRRALTGIPKQQLKFLVGSMMMSFGTFYAGEGIGIDWPVKNLALMYGALMFAVLGAVSVGLLRVGSAR